MAIFTESSNRQLTQPGAAAEGRIARFGSAQPRTNVRINQAKLRRNSERF